MKGSLGWQGVHHYEGMAAPLLLEPAGDVLRLEAVHAYRAERAAEKTEGVEAGRSHPPARAEAAA